jgi:dolichol-phosphate mannosyltransferase
MGLVQMDVGGMDFPDYKVSRIVERTKKYCICVFVINEGEKIQKQIAQMEKLSNQVDIVIADGGSTDGSLESELLKKHKVTALLTKVGGGKLSAQMRMAFHFCLEEEYEGVITIDGNGKDDLSSVSLFIDALNSGYDHVQGSRFIDGGKAINTPLSRYVGLRLIHAPLISIASRRKHTDTTNGFRAYSKKLLISTEVNPFRNIFQAYELHYYLAIRASRLGFKLCEVPVTRTYPSSGKIPTKISPIKGNLLVLKTLFKAVMHKYDPE